MNVIRAFIWNRRRLYIDASLSHKATDHGLADRQRENAQAEKPVRQKVPMQYAVAPPGRSSDEVFVMKMERRAWVIQVFKF